MIGFMAANEAIRSPRGRCSSRSWAVSALPPPPADNGPATEAPAASADASRDVEMLMRMVRLFDAPGTGPAPPPESSPKWFRQGAGGWTFHLGREASALVAAISRWDGPSSPVWMGNAPATELRAGRGGADGLGHLPLFPASRCHADHRAGGLRPGPGCDPDPHDACRSLSPVTPPIAARPIIPGQGAASAEGPQPDVLPMETDGGGSGGRKRRGGVHRGWIGVHDLPQCPLRHDHRPLPRAPISPRTTHPGTADGRRFSSVDGQASFYVFAQYDALGRGAGCDAGPPISPPCSRSPRTAWRRAATRIAGSRDGMAAMRRVIMDSDGHDPHLRDRLSPRRARRKFCGRSSPYMADSSAPFFRPFWSP